MRLVKFTSVGNDDNHLYVNPEAVRGVCRGSVNGAEVTEIMLGDGDAGCWLVRESLAYVVGSLASAR